MYCVPWTIKISSDIHQLYYSWHLWFYLHPHLSYLAIHCMCVCCNVILQFITHLVRKRPLKKSYLCLFACLSRVIICKISPNAILHVIFDVIAIGPKYMMLVLCRQKYCCCSDIVLRLLGVVIGGRSRETWWQSLSWWSLFHSSFIISFLVFAWYV